jgi:hypothetical protein
MRAAPRPPSISLIGDALDTISIKTQRRWRRPRSGRYFAARHMMVPLAILSPPICTKGSPASSASGQRIFGALVQPANTITVESLLSNFQLGRQKKFGRQFLDRKADGVRGSGKSSVADRLAHSAPRGEQPHLARDRRQLGFGAVIECDHLSNFVYTRHTVASQGTPTASCRENRSQIWRPFIRASTSR